jgi:uncharacterized membrane protein
LNRSRTLLTTAYLALIVLQPAWHALAPSPRGNESWVLAGVAVLPLLLPLRGLLAGSLRSMTWAGYLVMLYLVVGVMEAWANPPQRIPALIQVGLVVVFIGGVLAFSRRVPRNREANDR